MNNKQKSPRVMFMAFRRGGSSIIFEALERLFTESGLTSRDIVAQRHLDPNDKSISADELTEAFRIYDLVGCFREPPHEGADLDAYDLHTVLVVRDPRDCDISWYYAQHLHAIEQTSFPSLDEYIEKIDDSEIYMNMVDFGRRMGARILRYEDIFMNPAKALMDMFAGTTLPLKQAAFDVASILLAFSRTVIDTKSHNRSGLPFQAATSLSDKSLALLNGRHAKLLADFNYPVTPINVMPSGLDSRFEIDAIKRFAMVLAHQNALRIGHLKHHDDIIDGMAKRIEALESELARLKGELL